MNGQESVYIDRGRWLYRFTLDAGSISISRSQRAGQYLAAPDVWRCVTEVGVTDVLIVPVAGGWQPFVELAEGRHRWALAQRATLAEAEQTAAHLLGVLADSISRNPKFQSANDAPANDAAAIRLPDVPAEPAESEAVEAALAHARAEREAWGWEMVYNRHRAPR